MDEEPLFGLPESIRPRWTERRAALVRASIDRRVRRRRVAGWAVAACSLAVAGCLSFFLLADKGTTAEIASQAPATPSAAIAVQSVPSGQSPMTRTTLEAPAATPLTPETELVVDPQGAGRAYVLRRGSARFVVSHDELHPFRVRVGPLVVEDLGTVFSVTRLSEHRFDIAVEEGNVAVLCGDHRSELGHGKRQIFDCREPGRTGATVHMHATAQAPSPKLAQAQPTAISPLKLMQEQPTAKDPPPRAAPTPAPGEAGWRSLAERGQYGEAYASLRTEGQASVRDETHELLLAADTARLSGHPSEAVPYLRRIMAQHANDPRADLAAFTLGRVLLDELGRPAEAAEAFKRARSSPAPLAEDALAREVEASARAGHVRRAHALALEYQRRYPQGRRMPAVVKFGGLE